MSIAVALLQGIAGGFLVIIFFVLIGGGLLLAAVLGRATGRRSTDRHVGWRERNLLPGRALCAVGLGFAAVGAFFLDIASNVLGMVLGMVGYYLGARVFGVIVIVLSMVTLIVGLLIGQGAIPGSYDEEVNGITKSHEK